MAGDQVNEGLKATVELSYYSCAEYIVGAHTITRLTKTRERVSYLYNTFDGRVLNNVFFTAKSTPCFLFSSRLFPC